MPVDTVADESALRQRYEETRSKYGTADQRLASHILVALPEKATPAQDAAALAKARDLAAKARQPGADFAALAKASSDDIGSRDTAATSGPWTRACSATSSTRSSSRCSRARSATR
jgi:peptidyl-prolyl cis-trans isomerase D